MTIAVRNRNTNEIVTKVNTNDWAKMFVNYIDGYRREYTNAVVEVYYTEEVKGNPVSKYNTFH
jgi:hypothetical protein